MNNFSLGEIEAIYFFGKNSGRAGSMYVPWVSQEVDAVRCAAVDKVLALKYIRPE